MSSKLLQSTVLTGGMTLISRVTGLIRDVIFAGFLGASIGPAADAFYVAFRIPNLFRRFFGEGAFSQAFVPVMSEYRQNDQNGEARRFVSYMAGRFSLALFIISVVGVVAAPLLVMALAPGFIGDEDKFSLTAEMVRIMFPYMMFISLVAMTAGILNSYSRFAAAAFTPVLLNLALIVAALWGAPYFERPVVALAWAVFVAGVVQLLFQFPFLIRIHMLPRPRLGQHAGVNRVFKLMIPAIFGSSVSQLNMIVNTILASFLMTGSVTWLYYSDRMMEFPLGVFGIALATVLLPSLSKQYTKGDSEVFSDLLGWAIRLGIIIGVPAAVALTVLAGPILATLFFHGDFLAYDVEKTMVALWAFAAGLLGFILVKVLAPGFYAQQDTKTPAKIAAVSFAVNIVLSLALIYPLQYIGLAIAISTAAYVNAIMLFVLLRKRGIFVPQPGWLRTFVQTGISAFAMAVVLVSGVGDLQDWLQIGSIDRIWRLLLWIMVGLITYVLSMLILGVRTHDLRSPAHH